MTRTRNIIQVEGKVFEFEHNTNANTEEEVEIIEKTRGRVFNCKLSKAGAKWIGKLCYQLSSTTTQTGTFFSFDDKFIKIKATIRYNKWGAFVHTIVTTKKQRKRAACLCFPSGEHQKGWDLLGCTIRDLLSPTATFPMSQTQNHGGSDHFAKVRGDFSFATACTSSPIPPLSPDISFRSGGAVIGASWWQPVILCHYDGRTPNWFWVRDKIRSACGEVFIKVTQEGEALLTFNEEKHKDLLLSLPPLSSWEGTYTFRKWGPMDGAFKSYMFRGDVNIVFNGIPYHLRSRRVVESLAQRCGHNYLIDESSIDLCKASCTVTLKDCEWRQIPRVITIEERGYIAEIMVEASRIAPSEVSGLVGNLPDFQQEKMMADRPLSTPTSQGQMLSKESSAALTRPPGFDCTSPSTKHRSPLANNSGLPVRSTNPFEDEQPGDNMLMVNVQNSFQPLLLLGEEGRPHISSPVAFCSTVPMTEGVIDNQVFEEDSDAFSMNSEPIVPMAQPARPKRNRVRPKTPNKKGFKGPFMGHQKWRWIAGNQRLYPKKQHIESVSRQEPEQSGGETQPQQCVLMGQQASEPGPSARQSLSPTNSFVESTPVLLQGEASHSSSSSQMRFSKEDIANSLLSCSTEDDFRKWIRWWVIPTAGKLGMTSSMGLEGQMKLFCELGKQMEGQPTINNVGDHLKGLFVPNVV
ncbi:hypothetical protein FRX31_025018 [Thalictrum thalictroides]|uniref:Uncharacterized protein n=1 Tax=Thalictrum thalictroides TaxID=46969 RepID=A0A7J6VKE8_THATH|nr:hypothetical protein FRX31_025018 [Thalictrum thalictroides]